MQPGTIGASGGQRSWIGLSLAGDEVSVTPLPSVSYLQSLDIEIGFNKRGYENSEPYSADEIARHFLKAMDGVIMSVDQSIIFEYHGQNIKGTIKGLSLLEIADEQRRGPPGTVDHGNSYRGVIMPKTDLTFMKDPTSLLKLKSSAKK